MKNKINNVVKVPIKNKDDFFIYWFKFLKPYHNLNDKEILVISSFLKHRFELSNSIVEGSNLNVDKLLFSPMIKKKVREECNLTPTYFQIIMSKLNKNVVIKDKKINPKFIPNIKMDNDKNFKLLLYFDLESETNT